jgi:hypothetical protein
MVFFHREGFFYIFFSAPLRENKQIHSRQGAKLAKVFRVTTKQTSKFSAIPAPLRELKTNPLSPRHKASKGFLG